MSATSDGDRSRFLVHKAVQEWSNPKPRYDPRKDPELLRELRLIEDDYKDDGGEQVYEGGRSSIFDRAAKGEVKEDAQ